MPDFLQTENRWAAEKALIDHKLKEKLEELKQRPYDWKLGSLGD